MRLQRFLCIQLLLATVLAFTAAGCKVTADDIEYWKGTVKGPGKIVAVMLSHKYPLELRSQAALALVQMDRQDVNGVVELQNALARVDEPTRKKIIDQMVPGLTAMMRGSDSAPQQSDSGGLDGPPPQQLRAKDAAYLLISLAGGDSRQTLIKAVVGWYVVDFNGRSLAGNYSAEQVVRSLGAPAAAMLINAMSPQMPSPALVKIAELIGQLGDAATKQRAATRLVDIEKRMEGDAFLAWLEKQIKEQLEQQHETIPADRLKEAAEKNRDNFINEGALPAMKHLADQEVVAERLLQVASIDSKSVEMVNRRKRALQALEGNAKEAHLDQLLQLALNPNNPVGVRDSAFDRVGDIHSKRAIPPLWPLVQNAKDQRLRWRAGELVLAIGGNDVVQDFFAKLPSSAGVEYAPEELEGYATRMSQMTPPPTDFLRTQLASPNWWNRVIALRYFERKGVPSDIAQMQPLTNDSAVVTGPHWADHSTVGTVATDAIKNLRQRLAQPPKAGHGSSGGSHG